MHRVEQGTSERIPFSVYPEEVTTGGMGPCAGVLIYDHDTKCTYGAHYPCPHTFELSNLQEFLDDALSDVKHSSQVSIFVGGCCNDGTPAGSKQSRKARRIVEAEVRKRFGGIAKIEMKWPAEGIMCTELILDPGTGNCVVQNDYET